MNEWQKLVRRLSRQIRPATYPLAISFLREAGDVSKEFRKPKVEMLGCNLFSLARRHGLSLVATVSDIACSAVAIFGFVEFSEKLVNWYSNYLGKIYPKKSEIIEKIVRSLPRIPYGRFSAITVSPLEKTKTKPDLIMIYLNPAQVHQILLGLYMKSDEEMLFKFTTGEPVTTCSYGLAKAYTTRGIQLVVPGTGDRRHGLTQDDELSIVIPAERLSAAVDGIEKSWKAIGRSYPVPMRLEVSPETDEYQKGLSRFRS